jgi:hypothetical protein
MVTRCILRRIYLSWSRGLRIGNMHHDWIFDVLKDLRSYALQNGLPATAAQADEALRVARAELESGLSGLRLETGRRN